MSPPKSGYETTKGKERKAEKEENSGKLKRKVRKIEQRSEGERIDSRTCVFQQVSPSATALLHRNCGLRPHGRQAGCWHQLASASRHSSVYKGPGSSSKFLVSWPLFFRLGSSAAFCISYFSTSLTCSLGHLYPWGSRFDPYPWGGVWGGDLLHCGMVNLCLVTVLYSDCYLFYNAVLPQEADSMHSVSPARGLEHLKSAVQFVVH